MRDPMWMSGDDFALGKDDDEMEDDPDRAWEMSTDR